MPQPLRLELFLDESGRFQEAPMTEGGRTRPTYPSQIAGILAEHGRASTIAAERVLRRAHDAVGLELGPRVHAHEIKETNRSSLPTLIKETLTGIKAEGWQLVRIVNEEGLGFGNKVASYTQMLAELVIRILEVKSKQQSGEIRLEITGEVVTITDDEGNSIGDILEADYRQRLEERLAEAARRRGLAQQQLGWQVAGPKRGGKEHRVLQICDIVSFGSSGGFRHCDPETKQTLKASFEPFDVRFSADDALSYVDERLRRDDVALAVETLALGLAEGGLESGPRFEERVDQIAKMLMALSAPRRDLHLGAVTAWLEGMLEVRRALVLGLEVGRWLVDDLLGRLRTAAGDTGNLEWFEFSLRRLLLTASNHIGDLIGAREQVAALDTLKATLAGRWENAPVLMQCLMAEAVHYTDCYDFDRVRSSMAAVASYYDSLGALMHDARPGVFPKQVRSDLRGQALGTHFQAEVHAGLFDPNCWDRARELNEQAIEEFGTLEGKQRQYQYRAGLEVFAGNFVEARRFLALGIGAKESSHEALATAVGDAPGIAQGFALLHWLRLGATALLRNEAEEAEAFLKAWHGTRLVQSDWATNPKLPYPAHGIRRRLAIVEACADQQKRALEAVADLRALDAVKKQQLALVLVQAATHLEVAGRLRVRGGKIRRLLDSTDEKQPGVLQLIDLFAPLQGTGLFAMVEGWRPDVQAVLEDGKATEEACARLLRHAEKVPY